MKLTGSEAIIAKATLGLLSKAPANNFPDVGSLSKTLSDIAPAAPGDVLVDANVARQFATASIDAWLRAIHSFLVSSALTDSSPIWSSVAGYYSSHYTVRSLSHLLGCYCLFRRKYIVRLRIDGGTFYCNFAKKGSSDREHKTYWKFLNSAPPFSADPLFPLNNSESDPSDVAHRDKANYADHLRRFYPGFRPVDEQTTKLRIQKISKIAFSAPPIPSIKDFPNVDDVQIVSYHRIVRYRRILDELIPAKNRFWTANREPTFASGYIDYQLVESALGDIMS